MSYERLCPEISDETSGHIFFIVCWYSVCAPAEPPAVTRIRNRLLFRRRAVSASSGSRGWPAVLDIRHKPFSYWHRACHSNDRYGWP